MSSENKNYTVKIPVLDLAQGPEMFLEFTAEVEKYLSSAESSVAVLKSSANDTEALDNLFKVFYTISGLAGFLDLNDIQSLATRTQTLLDLVRKRILNFDRDVAEVVQGSIGGMQKLIVLLAEQVKNNGRLNSPYFDVGEIIQIINQCIENRNLLDVLQSKVRSSVKSQLNPEIILNKYSLLEEQLKKSGASVAVDTDTVKDLIVDLKSVCKKLHEKEEELRAVIRAKDSELKASQQAQTTAKAKSDYLASMSHEIRTLINAVLGFADLISKSTITQKQKEYLDTIKASSRLQLEIVNDILDFSKIERGKLTLEIIDLKLDQLVDDVLKIVKPKLAAKPVKLYADIAKDVPNNIKGDPTRLKQILINLVDNAIKFTEKGEIVVSVVVEETVKEVLRFMVRDTGIGVPVEKKDVIFELFKQADISTTRKYGGSGLGLAICKGYIEAMGGRIWVESAKGLGSKFIFTIKLPKNISENDRQASAHDYDFKREDDLKGSCIGVKVLVVEDSMPNQELIKVYFEHLGCAGEFVDIAEKAIEKIKANRYDLCFMDLQLPSMSGLEATRIIRSQLKQTLPIVALTATTLDERDEEHQTAGVTDYLEKPFDMVQLAEKIIYFTKKKT